MLFRLKRLTISSETVRLPRTPMVVSPGVLSLNSLAPPAPKPCKLGPDRKSNKDVLENVFSSGGISSATDEYSLGIKNANNARPSETNVHVPITLPNQRRRCQTAITRSAIGICI